MTRATDRAARGSTNEDGGPAPQEVAGRVRVGTWTWDRATGEVHWSDEIYRRHDAAPMAFELSSDGFFDRVHPDDRQLLRRATERAVSDGAPCSVEYRLVLRDGSFRLVHALGSVVRDGDGEVTGLRGTLDDVTAERAQRESKELRLRRQLESVDAEVTSILEAAPDPIIVIDERGAIVHANAATARVFGWELSEITGRNVAMLAGGDLTAEQHDRYIEHFMGTGEASTDLGLVISTTREVVGRRKDGTEFPIEISVAEVANSDGPRTFTAVLRDISDRVAAYEALRESEAHYRALVENVQDGIALIDSDGPPRFFNEALCKMLGYTRDEMARIRLFDIVPAEDRDGVSGRIAARMGGDPLLDRITHRRLVRKDGAVIDTEVSRSSFVRGGRVVGSLVQVRDVTEQLRLREQLLQSQKLEAVGTLVAGVAHDFNNLLTAIDGSIEIAQDEGADSPWLKRARVATDRAAELVQQLMLASRPGDATRVEMDLAELARETVGLVRQTFDRRIDIRLDAPQEPVCVWADSGQLHQVLMNLFVNARDAVGEAMEQQDDGSLEYQPRITLTLTRREQPEGREADCWAELRLHDNGAGMPPGVRERIFDPFFTTKGVDGGTGLGLFTVYGIVKEHGGSISVESATGEGAVFTIRLPIVPVATHDDAPRTGEAVEAAGPGRGKRVLVVDDEPVVIELAHRALTRARYDVTSATGGDGALRLLSEQSFDLVLLDVNMPAPNGWQTLHAMIGDDPDQLVLMLSGFALDEEAREHGACGLLRKPFNSSALLSAVDDALNHGSG